ncbi:hypothetical protein E2C01_091341 [Portunus trituberculatus]|uniref:Uncharacterized protein n=1 Tax=Portunus trituberculatus TaxID=210409 RepID=A0A5B7JNT0_PORTR|nr:hypothetical protein [Portunus trituberculatus]
MLITLLYFSISLAQHPRTLDQSF